MNKDEIREKTIRSIEDSKYKWRTISGISGETNIPRDKIYSFLISSNEIVKARNVNQQGHELFTTRKKQKKNSSVGQLILSRLLNKASLE